MEKFCNITTRNELADFLAMPRWKLTHLLYVKKIESYYTSFDIPKKTGGMRHIDAPIGDLKVVQKKLASALWEHQESVWESKKISPKISHAFEKHKSILTNARVHRNKRILLNIDLENFFGSIHFGRVCGFFEKNREFHLPREVAIVIAQLACYKGSLPQGAPSSPIITNMISQILDNRLLRIAKQYKLDYTRYADDLTFSTNDRAFLGKQDEFFMNVTREINNAGFSINEKKTRVQFRHSKQVVTGLVVNEKLNVDHEYYRETRAMAHSLYKHGCFEINGKPGTVKQLEGRFSFINQLNSYNDRLDKVNRRNFGKLNGKEKQFQKFLFYRYFFSNDKPLIVTEGKTDVVYLKSALKSLYLAYPNLVVQKADGTFEFKVSFFKRDKRMDYFFGISQEGADAMKNLYNFFDSKEGGKKSYPDYFSYFCRLCSCAPKNPVILVFDNEIANNKKPLYNFANHVKLDEERKEIFAKRLYIKLIESGSLFLLTHQLVAEKKECEIEDLFPKEVLEYELGKKTFSRASHFDTNRFYGKEIFSRYISTHYRNIDFSGFKSILDSINAIVASQHHTNSSPNSQ